MPRAGLTPAAVVAEAGALADEVGLERLTLAAVAQRLGVRLPSLYKHVDGLDGLRSGLAAAACRELAEVATAATVGRAGDEALLALATAYRTWARARPGTYAATLRAPAPGDSEHEAAAEALMRVVAAALAGYRLDAPDLVDAVRGLRAVLHGFVSVEAAGGYALPQDPERSFTRLVEGYALVLRSWSGAPTAGAVA